MAHGAYSSLKIFHHRSRLTAMAQGLHVAPIHVHLVATNRCNQSCKGCAYRMKGYGSSETFDMADELPWAKLVEIVNDCQEMDVRAIQLTGGGEPTVHPEFLSLCEMILGEEIDLALVTNGVRWTPDHTRVLRHAKWVRFSIDAGCADTYAQYRRAPRKAYDKVRSVVREMAASDRAPNMLVGVGFVVNEWNWSEVVEATERARDDGADNIRISALFQSQGSEYFREFHAEAREACRAAECLATDTFVVFNLFGERIQDLFASSPDYSLCGMSRLMTYIGADQNVYLCCMNAYNPYGLLGTLDGQRFRDVWCSEEVRGRLLSLDATHCPLCMYNGKNAAIAYAIDTNPPHVNFV